MKRYYFKIKNEWGKYLNLLFKDISDVNYVWQLVDEEIFTSDGFLFNDENNNSLEILDNVNFWSILSIDEYYINFAKIKLFKNNDDLKNDNWAIYLDITDSEFVVLKINDSSFVEQISENMEEIRKFMK